MSLAAMLPPYAYSDALIVGRSARICHWHGAMAQARGTNEQKSRTLGQPLHTPVAIPDDRSKTADVQIGHRHAGLQQYRPMMDARLQRRVQRYGWDLAAIDYEPLWQAQLAEAQAALLSLASLEPGDRVLDIACGTGLVSFGAARAVGPEGHVLGIDLSERMVDAAERRARDLHLSNCSFSRMDAETLALPDASFDVVLCALGLMYMPDPEEAVREMRRVLRPGGRVALAVWGERSKCGWSAVFPIVAKEVASEVCPLFFRLGQQDALARLCAEAKFEAVSDRRITTTLTFADAIEACDAAFVGGPVALAWSRFNEEVRARVRARYRDSIESWREGHGYRVPGEFVIATATAPRRPMGSGQSTTIGAS
jgi:ubiquinone/menaquinone biosynthesis C-methylase UbiE